MQPSLSMTMITFNLSVKFCVRVHYPADDGGAFCITLLSPYGTTRLQTDIKDVIMNCEV